ncbi:hypothetical protein TWF694_003653 [Orbilia ellipsospora]|uniref:Autophagy-related protein 1 n=1 Tax=Orbilia ellipsospora TaxID=2528407 RepID=A0AAV9WZP0_9PEZI
MRYLQPSSASSHSSDIQVAVSQLQLDRHLIGYRDLLSYTNALGVSVLSRSVLARHLWVLRATGQYSAVYESVLAKDPPWKVVIKRPKVSLSRDDTKIENVVQHTALSAIIQELRILAHQDLRNHPNLPHILGVFFEDELKPEGTVPCLVFERAVTDLSSYLRENCPVPAEVMILLSSDIASALSAVHSHGLTHGDLKPQNILLFQRGGRLTAALADFGTCGVTDQSYLDVGVIPGTIGFWAPEYYRDSKYHKVWVNKSQRDIYCFGLILFSIMTHDQAPPFPESSFRLQHNDRDCLDFLKQRSFESSHTKILWDIIEHCVLSDPETRWSLAQIISTLRTAQGADEEYDKIESYAQEVLLRDPANPRVNSLNRLELSKHLHSKLVGEYVTSSQNKVDIRLAITIAALYSGAIGPALEAPFCFVAKAQWLLKAIELGSTTAIDSVFRDRNAIIVVETLGKRLLEHRALVFNSPTISHTLLIHRLKEQVSKGDIEALNLLAFLGEPIPESRQLRKSLSQPLTPMEEKIRQYFPRLQEVDDMKSVLNNDMEIVDSDAYDLIFSQTADLLRDAYNDDLEGLMRQSDFPTGLTPEKVLLVAILGGSVNVVRYIIASYSIDTNASAFKDDLEAHTEEETETEADETPSRERRDNSDPEMEWEDTDSSASNFASAFKEEMYDLSFLDLAIILGRQAVVKTIVGCGGRIHGASTDQPSSLHYLARFDDDELTRIVSETCPGKDVFRQILESKPSEGKTKGTSAIECNFVARNWKNILWMLRYTENLGKSQGESNLLYLALSGGRPVPLPIIEALLDQGFDPDIADLPTQPPLYWTIGQSNVAATYALLSRGANSHPRGASDLVSFAKECRDETNMLPSVIVVDEFGTPSPGGLEMVKCAAETIYSMIFIASRKNGNWLEQLANCMSQCPEACKGKIWQIDNPDPLESTMLLELSFPTQSLDFGTPPQVL